MLRKAVRARANKGHPIQTVVVKDCDLPEELYDNWTAGGSDWPGKMPELDWDLEQGCYGTDEDEDEDEDGDGSGDGDGTGVVIGRGLRSTDSLCVLVGGWLLRWFVSG